MDIPILGIIENMSYFECPDCGKRYSIFGECRIEEIAAKTGLALAGRIPIEPSYSEKADEGKFAQVDNMYIHEAMDCLRKVN